MIYLASPYSHPEPAVREQRFFLACCAAATLISTGHMVFAPVVHFHPLVAFGLPTDWSFWQAIDRQFLSWSEELVVLKLDGWRESIGVQAELQMARELAKPIRFIEPIRWDAPGTPTLAGGLAT